MKKLPFFRRPWFAKRILEIGGGHSPYSGITHAVDKFPDDNRERAAAYQLPEGVEFREGELEAIPFPSEPRFDFLYLSHVLEHSTNPGQAIREINRIAKRGYIETPSPLREQIAAPLPFDSEGDFHRLFVWKSSRFPNAIAVIRKNAATLGEFTASPDGKLAETLFRLRREKRVDLEPLLSNEAKTSRLHFDGEIRLLEYDSFKEAENAGDEPYSSSRSVRRSIAFPIRLRSGRFRLLARIFSELEPSF